MTEPINVTPGATPSGGSSTHGGAPDAAPDSTGERWTSVSWTTTRGPNIPWIGVLLVLLGVGLLIGTVFPQVNTSTLALLAIAAAFLVSWVFGRSHTGMILGLLTLALGTAELIEDMALLGPAGEDIPGLWSASLAIAFLAIWIFSYLSGRRRSFWPLWGALIFGALGFVELSSGVANLPQLSVLLPLVIIGVGVVVLLGARNRTA